MIFCSIFCFRLYESHKRVQKVNQSLEDKLLKIVDKCETEKTSLTREVATLTQKLVEAEGKINRLQDENVSSLSFFYTCSIEYGDASFVDWN